jgi:phage-related protein (TIGR01555 family)
MSETKPKSKWITSVKDSFQNFALNLGKGTNNASAANTYGYNPLSNNRLKCEWMYRSSWICKAAIDTIANDMTKTGLTIHGIPSEQADIIQKRMSDLNVWHSINNCIKWARLYGGAVGYIMIDGQDASTPLDIKTIREGQFRGIMPLGRYQLNPMLGDLIEDYGPDYGLPRYYQIIADSDLYSQPTMVHHSRMIRFVGIEQPYYQRISLMFWGLSVLENLEDRLEAFDMISTGINQMSNKAHLRTLKIEGLRDMIAMGDEPLQNLLKYVNQLRITQSNEGITLLDMQDELDMQPYNFSGLAEILNLAGEQIAAALDIPQSILFGRQADGLGASQSGDIEIYFGGLQQKRENELRRPFGKILQILAQESNIPLDDTFRFTFDNLWELSTDEIAKTSSKTAGTLVALVEAGIISIIEARNELKGQSLKLNMFNNLEENKIPEINSTEKEE